MCGSSSVPFTRIYNQASLKELCASILKQHYISNVRNMLDKLFAKKFNASEMCYLTGPSKEKIIPVMLHILSMSSSTSLPIPLEFMALKERSYLLESYLKSHKWGYLEMFMLLSEDIQDLDFDGFPGNDLTAKNRRCSDLLVSLLISRCPKLDNLSLKNLHVPSTSLVNLCTTMCHITILDLGNVLKDSSYNEVLIAISTGMPRLEVLDISGANVLSSAIRYLLPTERPLRRGCPELIAIDMSRVKCIDVDMLKDFILGLPKLEVLEHLLMANVLAEITDKDFRAGLRCLTAFALPSFQYGDFSHISTSTKLRYDILQKAPEFAKSCDIWIVVIDLKGHTDVSLTDLLMPLTKLETIHLYNLSNFPNKDLLTVLGSKGHQLKELHLNEMIETISLHDIVTSCPSLCKFTLKYACSVASANDQKKQLEEPSGMPYLSNLEELTLVNLSEQICSSVMLKALLVSPHLEKIKLTSVEVMSNDHLLNAHQASSPCQGTSFTSLRSFHVEDCPKITAAPFVSLLAMDDTKLDELHIENCDMDDEDILHEAVENYPRPLNVKVRPINKSEFPGHMGTAFQGPCVKHCHYCAYDRRLSKKY